MRAKLAAEAVEKSTYVVTLAFADRAGVAVTPDSCVWTLSDRAGTIINARTAVALVPAPVVSVVLSGDDLAMQAGEPDMTLRLLTVEGTYTSTEGDGLPIREEYAFNLRGLVVVE